MGNRYGLDADYFRRELKQLESTLEDRRPEELARYLRVLADAVILETPGAEEGKAEPRPGGLRSIEEVLAAIDAEPEFPGEPPPEMMEALRGCSEDVAVHALRLAVRMTKDGIRERILAQAPTAQSAPPPAGPESPPVEPDLFDLVHQVHEAMKRGGWKSFHAHGLAVTPTEAHGPLVSDFPAPPVEPPAPRPVKLRAEVFRWSMSDRYGVRFWPGRFETSDGGMPEAVARGIAALVNAPEAQAGEAP